VILERPKYTILKGEIISLTTMSVIILGIKNSIKFHHLVRRMAWCHDIQTKSNINVIMPCYISQS